ncbi:MAG TPA: SRPBCC family protein [Candidatus Acidoferrales bacterium]|nr:SRPBCC family protein [Candidatus Acidoferrales bacterium]
MSPDSSLPKSMAKDRIEKKILLHAPRSRVWRALSDPAEFGAWFGMKFEGPFTPGARVRATIVGTAVDADVAKTQKEHAGGVTFEITIDRVEPERLFSFRWHPGEPGVDYSNEPATLVAFTLEETPNGVMLTVTESGFDKIPFARRAKAFEGNEQGWSVVLTLIEKHLAQAS